MFCPFCGGNIADTAKVCPRCGASLTNEIDAATPSQDAPAVPLPSEPPQPTPPQSASSSPNGKSQGKPQEDEATENEAAPKKKSKVSRLLLVLALALGTSLVATLLANWVADRTGLTSEKHEAAERTYVNTNDREDEEEAPSSKPSDAPTSASDSSDDDSAGSNGQLSLDNIYQTEYEVAGLTFYLPLTWYRETSADYDDCYVDMLGNYFMGFDHLESIQLTEEGLVTALESSLDDLASGNTTSDKNVEVVEVLEPVHIIETSDTQPFSAARGSFITTIDGMRHFHTLELIGLEDNVLYVEGMSDETLRDAAEEKFSTILDNVTVAE